MNLYLDEDCAKGALVARLRKTGHLVLVPADALLQGASDPRHLLYAVQYGLVIVTRNHDDFEDLHLLVQATLGRHSGILAIRFENDPTRDMKDGEIARAIRNLDSRGLRLKMSFTF
jgi:predicted nuclease of predicted toxin-antitoxin system